MLLFEGLPVKPLVCVKHPRIEKLKYVSSDDEDSYDEKDNDWKPASEKPGILNVQPSHVNISIYILYINIFDSYARNFIEFNDLF